MSGHYNISGASTEAPLKDCMKCGVRQPITAFYAHKGMADGHLNKCKGCTKKDVKGNYGLNVLRPDWVNKERERGREKYYRLEYKERYATAPKPRRPSANKKELAARYWSKFPEKKKAHSACTHLKPQVLGNHLHHWSYATKEAKNVLELSPKDHYTAHRFIVYDQPSMMYRRKDTGELLDTRQKHEDFIFGIMQAQLSVAA